MHVLKVENIKFIIRTFVTLVVFGAFDQKQLLTIDVISDIGKPK